MKELNDDDLQKILEDGLNTIEPNHSSAKQKDIEAYRLVFDGLKQEPADGLPYNFATGVVRQVKTLTQRAQNRKLYALVAILTIGIAASVYGMQYFTGKPMVPQLSNAIAPYKWVVVFGAVCLAVVQYLDWKVVKKRDI